MLELVPNVPLFQRLVKGMKPSNLTVPWSACEPIIDFCGGPDNMLNTIFSQIYPYLI